jgi:hypothetical protein
MAVENLSPLGIGLFIFFVLHEMRAASQSVVPLLPMLGNGVGES